VQKVLITLGLEPTWGNFVQYDKRYGAQVPIDWMAVESSLKSPRRQYVRCYVLDEEGYRVQFEGRPATVYREVSETVDMSAYGQRLC